MSTVGIVASQPWRAAVSEHPVNSLDARLFHKTTDRTIYDWQRSKRPDVDTVLLVNEHGELTEGLEANLVVELAT